jgi:hypothetical protein
MEITVELSDEFFEEDALDRLMEFFEKEDEFKNDLKKLIPAALSEYINMLVGNGIPSSVNEIRQYRLYYLIKHYYKGKFPSEEEVSAMFQETQSRSKSLIRLVLTRFRYDLKDEIKNAIIDVICSVKHKEGNNPAYHVTIQSEIIAEEMNRIINKEAPTFLNIKKISGMGRRYIISPASYCKLKELYCPVDVECPGCPGSHCNEED